MNKEQGLFVGLIPDGNRRWALNEFGKKSKDDLTRDELYEGYWMGYEAVRGIMEHAREECIAIIVAWGGSVANLQKRPPQELQVLHSIYERCLQELRDQWMDRPENKDVRFVHLGRTEKIREHAPGIVKLLAEIAEHTRQRSGMVIAFCLDYAGLDEQSRAIQLWREQGSSGDVDAWKQHLDLPRQGVPFQPVDLIIRTGTETQDMTYDNEYLQGYKHETRFIPHTELLPDYTLTMFRDDLALYRSQKKNQGA